MTKGSVQWKDDGVPLPTLREQLAGCSFHPSFGGSRCALDFAVTNGLRCGSDSESAGDGSYADSSYEARKRSHLDTDSLCKEAGLLFIPMVMEASGRSWGPAARKVCSGFGNAAAKFTGESLSQKAEELSQTLSVILHRANARSVLCRSHSLSPADPCAPTASARADLGARRSPTSRGGFRRHGNIECVPRRIWVALRGDPLSPTVRRSPTIRHGII
eukprot:gene12323-biopygen11584